MKFHVIGDEETVLGFNLAGVEGVVVTDPGDTRKALDEAFKIEDIGIIVMPERIAASIRSHVDQYMFKTSFPLIIEIPDRLGPLKGRATMREMIRSAVGVRI